MRTAIQNKIMLLCKTGTFPVVTYEDAPVTTFSTDAFPSDLQGHVLFVDNGELKNVESVLTTTDNKYRYWFDGDKFLLSLTAEGYAPSNFFTPQGFPDTITLSGAGSDDMNLEYTYEGIVNSNHSWRNGIRTVGKNTATGKWWVDKDGSGNLQYNTLTEPDTTSIPPKDPSEWENNDDDPFLEGEAPSPTLSYGLPTTLLGNGAFTGTMDFVTVDMKEAKVSATETAVPGVVVGETSGNLTKSVRAGGRTGKPSMENWQFEAHLKFNQEVSVDYFLKNELKVISFVFDNELVRVTSTGFPVSQPPRQQPHNGTEMVITFSVNTRR